MQLEMEFPDQLSYRVRRSPRARNPSVSVCLHEGVVLTLPQRFDERRVPALIREWQPWIRQHVDRFEKHRARMPAEMISALPEQIRLPACGGEWRVVYDGGHGGNTRLKESEGLLRLRGEDLGAEAVQRALRRWLARQAREHLQRALDRLAGLHGMQYKRLTVRGQRTRWGSCSSTGTISLNYLLMFLSADCADSVVLHELCHTRYMSHGPRFYGLLQRLEPRYRELDRQVQAGWQAIPNWAWPRR